MMLVETIIANSFDKNNVSGSFWDKLERQLMQSILLFTVDGFPPEARNIKTALNLISMLEFEGESDNEPSDLDLYAEYFAERFGKDHIAVQEYKKFRSAVSDKVAISVAVATSLRLATFRRDERLARQEKEGE